MTKLRLYEYEKQLGKKLDILRSKLEAILTDLWELNFMTGEDNDN